MCGTQLKEDDKFCSGCGYRLDGAEAIKANIPKAKADEEIDEVEDNSETSGGLSVFSMIVAFLAIIIVFMLGVIIKKSMSDTPTDEKAETVEGEEQKAGTQFSNLGYQCGVQYITTLFDKAMKYDTGRITYSDGILYFYEWDGIYAIDEDGERTKVCSAEGASSLNMNGRDLYFLEGTYIYKVNVKSGEKTEILSVEGKLPFFMYGDIIYYVATEYITATQEEFCILGYDVDQKEEVVHINVGSEQPIIIEVTEDGCITYYYLKSWVESEEQASRSDVCYELRRVNRDGDVVYSTEMESKNVYWSSFLEFTAFRGDNSIYATWTYNEQSLVNVLNPEQFLNRAKVKADDGYLQLKNSYKDDLIVYGMINGKKALYLIPEDLLVSFDMNSPLIKEIIYESSGIVEVYVIGDYIYYTVEDVYWGGSDYDTDNLYRIKVDGTGWEDI